ncbi:hypothetical protein K435DRAFT_2958 [Dendrothele bispora CBS 962.96]|uniref:Uncharacterized protein n=1 Tax=Dendrothele bispora (strain CBS 962.96) TaxID=1314807 RepID=A0A4S8MY52_DENBC|nr:hypothetical protein K435DRAFT_2958 [Dendrothele bispora CBS 962.96]
MADDDPVENFIHNLARINRYQRMLDAETQREMDNLQQRLMNQVQAGQIARSGFLCVSVLLYLK